MRKKLSAQPTDKKPNAVEPVVGGDKRLARSLLVLTVLFGLLLVPYLIRAEAEDQLHARGDNSDLPSAGDAVSAVRGRVKIKNGNVVADNNYPLRGEHVIFADNSAPSTPDGWLDRMYDVTYWTTLRDDFHLNTVRLMMMRPPQNWPGGPGTDCFYPAYRCYNLNYKLSNGKKVIQIMDDMVDMAAQVGMYIIIDYHPVGGHDEADAVAWWNSVAPRYKNRTHVLYELANEPVAWNASKYGPADIAFEENLYELIRGHAPNTHIILWTFANATGPMLEKVQAGTDINYGKASVGFHPYGYDEATVLGLRSHYPVINTEIGSSRLAKTQQAENIGVSWIWLGGAKTHGVSPNGLDPSQVFWPKDPGSGSTPPTSTAVPPTTTPRPTKTAVPPTSTPKPTKTAVPPTSTPRPTNTPGGPTDTPIPPTNTPLPTNTPQPTNTPGGPTNTPTSTYTPAPGHTPGTPTNTPEGPTNTPLPPDFTPEAPTSTSTPVRYDNVFFFSYVAGGG